ncbi:laccase-5-like isoform X1 [Lingula anatina]|uniref:Laccase-5-like isoform X1 n=2 Tax=Lingula anatina TaxID=7574 RepID=A0A1S3HH84_LINAN|nr:laccase-5-like isoform X1 [Lingula anatina]|eukprot:XP_013385435.1 laccase-5-like isoform X1 [Lingula anatina]
MGMLEYCGFVSTLLFVILVPRQCVGNFDGCMHISGRLVCEYHLEFADAYTMTYENDRVVADCTKPDGSRLENGCVACKLTEGGNCGGNDSVASIPFESINTGDGIFRRIVTVNGSLVGPILRGKVGAQMVIHVTNHLYDSPLTIHWHGQFQYLTPFMDGVPMITQCPIEKGQTFTYRFKADPAGTFWYHAHTAGKRSDGGLGALIIHEDNEPNAVEYNHRPDLGFAATLRGPPPHDKHVVTLLDWQHEHMSNVWLQQNGGSWFWPNNPAFPTTDDRFSLSFGPDGVAVAGIPYVSALINGRGRFENPLWYQDAPEENNKVPYERFYVDQTHKNIMPQKYRFRIIGAQLQFALRFSVDAHLMTIIASDGFDMVPIRDVESLIVNPGERYDVVIHADNPLDRQAYWIRAAPHISDPGYDTGNYSLQEGKALLIYGDETSPYIYPEDVPEVPRPCVQNPNIKCVIVNCNYNILPPSYNARCINPGEFRNRMGAVQVPGVREPRIERSENLWMNFAFQTGGPGVNGISFREPTSPPLSQPDLLPGSITECPATCRDSDNLGGCKCTGTVNLNYNRPYQFVFTNVGAGGANTGAPHPVHMHGHSFYVLKVAYPEQSRDGLFNKVHPDICCPCPDDESQCCTTIDDSNRHLTTSTGGVVLCNNPRFVNRRWNRDPNRIQGLELNHPLQKDTIIVPAGGYTVVRIMANNPGWWLVHCHIEMHATGGMAFVMNEAAREQEQLHKPRGFTTCSNFESSAQDYYDAMDVTIRGSDGRDRS